VSDVTFSPTLSRDLNTAESDAADCRHGERDKQIGKSVGKQRGAKLFFRRCENETEFRVSAVLVRVLIC